MVLGGELQKFASVHVLIYRAIRNTRLSDSFLSQRQVEGPIELRNGTASSGETETINLGAPIRTSGSGRMSEKKKSCVIRCHAK